jgi:hypothetical protein
MDRGGHVRSRFRRDLPGYVLLWVAVTAIAVVLQVVDGRGTTNPFEVALAMSIIGVALVPLVWLRHAIPVFAAGDQPMRRTVEVIGAGCLWTVVALGVGFFALTLIGIR